MDLQIKLKTSFLSVFILIGVHLNAQTNKPRFENFPDNIDITGRVITRIQQDNKGFIWISTTDGLFKYDGYSSTRYSYNPFNSHSVSQNMVYTFYFDKKDTMWIGTPEGLCKLDLHTEKFTRYDTLLIPRMPDLGNVSVINEDDQGYLWIGNFEGKLWRFNLSTNEFLSLTEKLNYKDKKSLAADFHEVLTCTCKDKNGTIFMGSSNGLYSFKSSENKSGKIDDIRITHYQHNPSDTNSLSKNIIANLYADSKGIIWISTTTTGLNSLNPETGKFTRYMSNPSDLASISTNNLNTWGNSAIQEDASGNLWIATDSGLNKLNKERTVFSKYFQNSSDRFSLKSNYLNALGLDAGGNLFIGTQEGLQNFKLNQKAFHLLQHDPEQNNSISDVEVMSVVEDKSGTVWIGTTNGGLNKWDKNSGTYEHIRKNPLKPNGLKSNYVSDILEDPDGNIWVCNSEYLSLLKRGADRFEHFNSNVRNLQTEDAKIIHAICRDKEGLMWLGTGNGIKSFDPVSKKFTHYFHETGNPNSVSDYTSVAVLADSKENIWVGNNSIGFDRFNKRTGQFFHYKNNPEDSTSISSNIVNCLFEDAKRNLWIGTSGGGLCQYNYSTNNFITHTRNKDLPWNSVFSIQEDNVGNLWLGTENGLSCYLVASKRFINYDVKDGLQGNQFFSGYRVKGCAFKNKDGILYFSGNNGLNYFDPAQIHPNNYIPPIVITQFKVFDKLQPGKNEANEIELKYNENFFSFEFAALNYTNASKNQYAYQLEGFDPAWVYCGSRRYVSYTNLDPGEYTFKVKGSNNDGIWNEKGVSIKIIIRPPWWRTRMAFVIYALLLIIAGLGLHRYQKRRVVLAERERARAKELAQAKEIEKAYHELKSTQSQLIQSEKMASLGELTAGIAHEIQNPLNFVNNFSEVNKELLVEMKDEMSKGNLDDANAIANDVIENEEKINHHGKRADAIVKGMLQHSRSSNGQKELTDINALVDEYLRLTYHGLRAKDKSFNAGMETNFDETIGKINIVSQDVGRALLNLFNNAFYSVNEKKKKNIKDFEPVVSVSTKKLNDKVEIRIKDNGMGISQKVLDKIFQPFFTTKPTGQGTGLGLSLSYDIIKAHGGELKAETKEGEGAEFIILLEA